MKMTRFEKRFVNASGHSREVSEQVVRVLQSLPVRAGERYLEVGAGNGASALRVAGRLGLDVTAVDVDPEQIELARAAAGARSVVRFEVADATRLPFDDESFDIVATFKTLHHVPRWRDAVAEMVRVLKPGGRLVDVDLVVPGWLAPLGRALLGRHAGVVTRRELQCLLEAQGLEITRGRSSGAVFELVATRPDGLRRCEARSAAGCAAGAIAVRSIPAA